MGQIQLTATLIASPAQSNDQQFPSGTTTIPFVTTPTPKPYTPDTGRNNIVINSPSAYQSLPGVGTAGPVTQAHTLYVRTAAPMLMQLTINGATTLSGIPIQGVFLMEFPPNTPITGVALQGNGAVEYYFAGNS